MTDARHFTETQEIQRRTYGDAIRKNATNLTATVNHSPLEVNACSVSGHYMFILYLPGRTNVPIYTAALTSLPFLVAEPQCLSYFYIMHLTNSNSAWSVIELTVSVGVSEPLTHSKSHGSKWVLGKRTIPTHDSLPQVLIALFS